MMAIPQAAAVVETCDPLRLVAHPTVSVIVITYNHLAFLEKAVGRVVTQIAPFEFEVIIAEDHSNDETLDIALALQRAYPAVVRVLHAGANVGANPNILRAIQRCRGDYIAFCEGDDLWTDPHKLEYQVEALAGNSSIGVCFTRGSILFPNGLMRAHWNYGRAKRVVPVREILKYYGIMVPTASLMWRTERLRRLPEWFATAPVGDLFMLLAGAVPNGALYLPALTVAYRFMGEGSWTSRLHADWDARKVNHARSMLAAVDRAADSFGVRRGWFRRCTSASRYVLFRHAFAARAYPEAIAHLLSVAPSFLLKAFGRRLTRVVCSVVRSDDRYRVR
jgi:glycosyltransferase involved in cell wall biosynthesis